MAPLRIDYQGTIHTATFQGDHWDVRPPSDDVSDMLEGIHDSLRGKAYMGGPEFVQFEVGKALALEPDEPALEAEESLTY